ncbi:MAG: hypothetical protein ABI551_23345 [Polyangiaceae bacterium]
MNVRRTTATALACGLACISAVGVAIAQPAAPVSLTWNAPAGCSDSASIVDAVSRLRNGTVDTEPMTAVASVTLDPANVWSLHITTTFADGSSGERDLQAESCKAAAEATASILALALTARAKTKEVATTTSATAAPPASASTASTTPPNPASSAATTANGQPSPNPKPSAAPAPTTRPAATGKRNEEEPEPLARPLPIRFHVGAHFGMTTGDLPSVGLGGGGTIGVLIDRVRVEGYADYWALAKARFAKPGGADFQLFSAGARTCLSFGGTFTLGPCAAFELGSMRGASFEVTKPSSGTALTADALLGALGMFSLDKAGHFALRVLLEVGVVLDRPEFVLTGIGSVHEPAPILGRGTVGAEIRF